MAMKSEGAINARANARQLARNRVPAKRVFDLILAVPAVLLFSPLLVLIGVLVRLDGPGPVLFRQERVGRWGRRFLLLKFRTMHGGTPDLPTDEMVRRVEQGTAPDPVTRVGRWLRRLSLDELPQLVNVLQGSMSLVGPRPALPTQIELNQKRESAGVHALAPGITGWAQINGRDDLDVEHKVARDVWYLQHRSLWLDVRILVRTLLPVCTGRGNR